jgi:THUMP domain-like
MTLDNERADIDWLTGDEAGAILADLTEDTGPLLTATDRLRRSFSAARTHLLLEQVELRRRAAAKFTHAEKMFFTRVGLEQATDEWVAHYKASRFTSLQAGSREPSAADGRVPIVADLCCGIGGDLMALAKSCQTIGIDRDPIAAHFAAANSGVKVHAIDVIDFDFAGTDAWHIDPDRRSNGRRTSSLEWCQPGLATIEELLGRVPNVAIKLAPATEPPTNWIDRFELEWISRDSECKQLVAWHGNLATAVGRRRATILRSDEGAAPRTIIGEPNQSTPLVAQPDRYVFHVDAAVLAARLTGALAAQHGLSALGAGPTYPTGSRAIEDAALACFEVRDVLPLRVRTLSQLLQARGIGQLEIKKRGVDIDPEKLRRDLKLSGENAATLLITNILGKPAVILAHRIVPLPSSTPPSPPLLKSGAPPAINE